MLSLVFIRPSFGLIAVTLVNKVCSVNSNSFMFILGIQEMGIPEAIIHAIDQLPTGRCLKVLAEGKVFIVPSQDGRLNCFSTKVEGRNKQIHFCVTPHHDTSTLLAVQMQ